MSDIGPLIERLVAAGLSIAEAGEIIATAFAAGAASSIPQKSSGAIRTQRWRERHKASQSVTSLHADEASQSVTKRHKASHRDVAYLSIDKKEEIENEKREGPAKPKASRRARLPDGWQLNERNIAYASERGFDVPHIESMAERFANHHRGKGTVMADWNAAWQTWVGNEIKFNGGRNGHAVSQARTIGATGSAATGADTILAGMGRIADRIAARKLAERQDSLDVTGEPDPRTGRA